MKLTLGKVKAFTRRALRDNNLDKAVIVSAEWRGKRSLAKYAACPYYFRVARVVIELDGRRVYKSVNIDTTGACRIG